MTTPTIIKDINVLQPATFNAGPRIGRIQHVSYEGAVTVVEFWYNNDGSIHRVTARGLRAGE